MVIPNFKIFPAFIYSHQNFENYQINSSITYFLLGRFQDEKIGFFTMTISQLNDIVSSVEYGTEHSICFNYPVPNPNLSTIENSRNILTCGVQENGQQYSVIRLEIDHSDAWFEIHPEKIQKFIFSFYFLCIFQIILYREQ